MAAISALDGTVTESIFRKRKACELVIPVTIDGAGAGTAVVVTLSAAFTNTPQMMVVLPLGCAGTWTTVYDGAVPSITVDTSAVAAAFQSKVVEVLLVAVDTV